MKDRVVEAAWSLAPGKLPQRPPSWPLDPSWLSSVSIRWPVRYQWPPNRKWVRTLRQGLSRFVPVVECDLSQPYQGIVLIELVRESHSWSVAIDISDYPVVNEACVPHVDLYFKMQYRREGYVWERVVPGGFVPADARIYRFLPRLRALAARGEPRFDVYGRFGLEFASELRRDAIRRLSESRAFTYEGGGRITRYSRFLREVAVAKVCINLPGNGDLCFRLIDYLAVGACVVGPRLRNALHAPLVDRVHVVYTRDDLSDLESLCHQYVEDTEARELIQTNARNVFDSFFDRDQLAAYYLNCCQVRLGR